MRCVGQSSPGGEWIKFPRVEGGPAFKLYWFPYSAGGASSGGLFFSFLPPRTEVICTNAPSKMPNPLRYKKLSDFVDHLVPLIVADLRESACPFAFVGHSFGALIAYMVLVRLRTMGHRMPKFVVMASKRAPQKHVENGDAELLARSEADHEEYYVKTHGKALPPRLLADKKILKSIVEAFTLDMKLNLGFWMSQLSEEERRPFEDIPGLVLRGDEDTVVSQADMEPWLEMFPAAARPMMTVKGGHMLFGVDQRLKEIMEAIKTLM